MNLGGKDKIGKTRLTLVPVDSLFQVATVFEYGAVKYGENNWRKGHRQLDLLDSCLRHICSHLRGDDIDDESKLPHLAHASANLFILLQQINDGTSIDNRLSIKK